MSDLNRTHQYGRSLTVDAWCTAWYKHANGDKNPELPDLPAANIQQITNNISGGPTMRGASRLYRVLDEEIRLTMEGDPANWQVLDYGAGWGRITRLMLRTTPPDKLFAFDVDKRLVASARKLLPGIRFEHAETGQKLPFADGAFDIIYANSVLSHLSREAHEFCLSEVSRMLRPGGIFIGTTLGKSHYELWSKNPRQRAWITALVGKPREFRRKLRNGRFIFASTGRWKDYGIAILSEEWPEQHWPAFGLTPVTTRTDYSQNVIIARRT